MPSRRLLIVVALGAACALVASCGSVPSERPPLAIDRGAAPAADSVDGPVAPPGLSVPESDLAWTECAGDVTATHELPPLPPGVQLDCSTLIVPVDHSGSLVEPIELGVARARLEGTPVDAPPVVLTTSTAQASSRALATMAADSSPLIASRPVVAVDRRGTGLSTPISCLSQGLIEEHIDLTRDADDIADRTAAVARISRESTLSCTDQLEPMETFFTVENAARDLELLRAEWGLDRLALVGSGEGATLALTYATLFPDKVSRLVLDSPLAMPTAPPPIPGSDNLASAKQQSEGAEAAMGAFAAHCTATDCALGPDPIATIQEMIADARAGRLGFVTPGTIISTTIGLLGDSKGTAEQRMDTLADALAQARNRQPAELLRLSLGQHAAGSSDGQYIGRCSDTLARATAADVQERAEQWRNDHPIVGDQLLLRTLLCTSWPTIELVPTDLEAPLPTMLLEGTRDPRAGAGTIRELRGQLLANGSTVSSVTWQGTGHGAALSSACAAEQVAFFITDGQASAATTCPR